jgi:osmotically-inducible protein OsmY
MASAEHEQAPNLEEVADDITHVLGHSWFFDARTIQVTIRDGVVRLTGVVRSERERRMAAAAGWAHEGVRDVENDLKIV